MKFPWIKFRGRGDSARKNPARCLPTFEILEDRTVLTTMGPIASSWQDLTFSINDQTPVAATTAGPNNARFSVPEAACR